MLYAIGPSPPTKVAAKTVNSSAIKVTWQAPLHPNGEIFFRLYYWQSSGGFGTRKPAYDGPMLEFVVAGLHEFVTYTFMVEAYNVKHSWKSAAVNVSETTHPAGNVISCSLRFSFEHERKRHAVEILKFELMKSETCFAIT